MENKKLEEMSLMELNEELKRCIDALEADFRALGVIK